MVSYRFLRPDDFPMISDSINICYNVHLSNENQMNLERIKQEAADDNVWASSCMVALEGVQPIAILVGARREGQTLIKRIGVVSDYQRQGHGTHLLTSLSAKQAIVGPPRMVAELPSDRGVATFFASCGFSKEADLLDFLLENNLPPLPQTGAVQAVPVADLLAQKELWSRGAEAWARADTALENCAKSLKGIALLSPERIEAALIYRDESRAEIVRFGYGAAQPGLAYVTLLLRYLRAVGPLFVPRLHGDELPFSLLEGLGFRETARYEKVGATARGD